MDEIVGWHHQFNGHEFEQALGDGEGAGQQYVDLAPDGLFPPQFCQTSRVTEQASLPLCAPSSRIYKMGFTGLLLSG